MGRLRKAFSKKSEVYFRSGGGVKIFLKSPKFDHVRNIQTILPKLTLHAKNKLRIV